MAIKMIPPPRRQATYVNQRNFVLVMAGLALAAIAGFFIYELKFLRPPRLEIFAPAQDIRSENDILDVSGRTDPDADLTLNGRPLYSGQTGEFSERVYLIQGLNRLEFEAKNRYGKVTRLARYIVLP
ncbi:MAG: hypothetical protein AAB650_01745 [Patescibacteria group bacterium]